MAYVVRGNLDLGARSLSRFFVCEIVGSVFSSSSSDKGTEVSGDVTLFVPFECSEWTRRESGRSRLSSSGLTQTGSSISAWDSRCGVRDRIEELAAVLLSL